MSKRLFNDNGGETLTPEGHLWSIDVAAALRPLMVKAVKEGVSIREFTAVVIDEITVLTAENLIRKGIDERKKKRDELKERNRVAVETAMKSD